MFYKNLFGLQFFVIQKLSQIQSMNLFLLLVFYYHCTKQSACMYLHKTYETQKYTDVKLPMIHIRAFIPQKRKEKLQNRKMLPMTCTQISCILTHICTGDYNIGLHLNNK